MSTPFSGKDGKVLVGATSQGDIISWRLKKSANVKDIATSESGGYAYAIVGSRRGTVRVAGLIDGAAAHLLVEGNTYTLLLTAKSGMVYTVPAACSDLEIGDVDIDKGEPVPFVCDFKSHGAWTLPTFI